jgi:hypothetical protein
MEAGQGPNWGCSDKEKKYRLTDHKRSFRKSMREKAESILKTELCDWKLLHQLKNN